MNLDKVTYLLLELGIEFQRLLDNVLNEIFYILLDNRAA